MNYGFLIHVGKNKPSSNFPQFEYQNVSVFFFDKKNKNIKYTEGNSSFNIYIGDQHFEDSSSNNLSTGLNISFKESTIIIKSDTLGSERVYYQLKSDHIIITNRIENLNQYCDINIDSIYSFLSGGFTVGSNTVLKDVYQTRQLETIKINIKNLSGKFNYEECWRKENKHFDYEFLGQEFAKVLTKSPNSNLMLSGGWDSRLLLSKNPERIKFFYTHGDIASREISITKNLAENFTKTMMLNPLQQTDFSVDKINEMLFSLGHCLFPHWYCASERLYRQNNLTITSGLGVEHISGHYGLNSLFDGKQKLRSLYDILITPEKYEKIDNPEAVKILKRKLSMAFPSTPWFFNNKINIHELNDELTSSVEGVINRYIEQGTFGINELSERFKMEHVNRQFFVLQTKTSCNKQGYYHPYVNSELAKLIIKIPYYKRVNYKLSQSFINQFSPSLLELPMAATLVSAKRPIYQQELSRVARILTEKFHHAKTGKVKKGLGWNNFQFLNSSNIFHEYIDNLKNDIWDKNKMHNFVQDFRKKEKNAYSLLEMLTKITTVDFQIQKNKSE